MMTRRSSAVLDAPEQRYASGKKSSRRVAAGLRRDLQEDFANDFDQDFGVKSLRDESFGTDDFDAGVTGEGSPMRRRVGLRGSVRPGLLGRAKNSLPRTLWGRIAAGVTVFGVIGLGIAGEMGIRSALLHDARFVIPASSAIGVEGNKHVTRAQLLSIFGGDVDRNIFTVSLAERRADLERLPWVEHATVMRLLPDHLRVSIVERTPVAFVRQGSHIGLVDKSGVLMDMVSGAGEATGDGARYSFPVVTGITASEPLSTRAARMKIFDRFTTELDSDGRKISEGLSEVDLSNPEDVKASIPDEHSEVLVHFGDSDFLDRYDKYKAHLAEWRTQYPRLSSVDMRYERQVVLEMQPGSAVPVNGTTGAATDGKSGAGTSAPSTQAHPLVAPPGALKPALKLRSAGGAKAVPDKPVPAKVGLKAAGPSPQGLVGGTPHLMVAKDAASARKGAAVKHPAAKKVVARKVGAKKVVAKRGAAKVKAAPSHHPSAQ